ncbi:MAG: DUF4124 domain-containing protein [Gammaproteobacteria bacterium]|nr:DUF4124 domain-containing protein [Gammaproteobacteria bacterium]
MAYWKQIAGLFLLVLSSLAFSAEIYMHTDEKGNIYYTDKPPGQESQGIPLTGDNTAPVEQTEKTEANDQATTATSSNDTSSTNADAAANAQAIKKPYVFFAFVAPANGESIQNQPMITVELKVDPELQTGDKVQIYLDDAPVGGLQASTRFQFTAPERGTHTLYARIMDEKKQIVKQSATITVYIHQAHVGSPGFQQHAYLSIFYHKVKTVMSALLVV